MALTKGREPRGVMECCYFVHALQGACFRGLGSHRMKSLGIHSDEKRAQVQIYSPTDSNHFSIKRVRLPKILLYLLQRLTLGCTYHVPIRYHHIQSLPLPGQQIGSLRSCKKPNRDSQLHQRTHQMALLLFVRNASRDSQKDCNVGRTNEVQED